MTTRLRPFMTRREVALKLDAVQDLTVLLEDVTPEMMPDDESREIYTRLKEAWLAFTAMLPHEYEVDPDPQLRFSYHTEAKSPSMRTYVVPVMPPTQAPVRDDD